MVTGYFSLILHAHLPYVRHPEHPEFLEEDWLYEAITEVYLPLIFVFQNLHRSGARPRLAMNVSPPLCEMLSDALLQERYTRHLENLLALARKEVERTDREAPAFLPVARMYEENLSAALSLWDAHYSRNLVRAFRELQDEGVLEIITCGATHGFLPLISTPEARRAQVAVAVENYRKHFGRQPRGIWLPECAYEPGVEDVLKDAGIEYFVADTHAVLYGEPRPRYGVYSPARCPNGVAVFARDLETSQQVWSSLVGYPGDPVYREFYRDLGWDAPLDYLLPHLHAGGERRHLGLKYHRITGQDVPQQHKLPYDPAAARERAAAHATHFVGERVRQARHLKEAFDGRPPLVCSPYDAELFGHWWFEGPQFIDFVFRKLHWDQDEIVPIAPGDFLDSGIPMQTQRPSQSSWGEDGYFKVWLNERNSWMYPHQQAAEERMTALANRHDDPDTLVRRALNQAARELLLAESSDWAFQIYQGTTVEYATRRFRSHIRRFDALASDIERGQLDDERLTEIESRDNIFAELDYRHYQSRQRAVGSGE
ncbi:MAG TPA: 1,4-alpha-glucan branching protein domain-containing protein [Pyrinomonadaceae bacterium]|nr:1,4-alpha-glucan branching protein domain-containing protein [Pyrinomonadaceae bacterium]